MSVIRVLLADDQDLIRSGLSMILSVEEDIEVVGQASNGQQVLELVEEHRPDIVLMDVQMPVMDGIEATAQLTQKFADTRVIMLTTFDREDYLFDALRAGAAGFLLKTAAADELVDAIHEVQAGHALLAPKMTLPLIRRLVEHEGDAPQQKAELSLTPEQVLILNSLTAREKETLQLLAQGLTNAEIAEELFVGAQTVKTHVSSILAKTHSRDRVNAAIFAHRVGLAR